MLPLSALTGKGLPELLDEIFTRITKQKNVIPGNSDNAIIDSLRQKELLERAFAALAEVKCGLIEKVSLDGLAVDLREALDSLGEITGEVSSAEILEHMFSSFCVGK